MAKILFLAHRAPFPPDKGDKIRAFHLLQHLAARHEVWLGAGVDDPADMRRLGTNWDAYRDVCIVPLGRLRRAFNMAWGGLTGAPGAGASRSPSHGTRRPRTTVPTGQPVTGMPS